MNELLLFLVSFSFFSRLGPTQNYRLLALFVVTDYESLELCEQQRKNSFHKIANLEVIKKETFVNCH